MLLATKDLPIVEWSRKDEFWGAKLYEEKYFIGINALGRLLMELREDVKSNHGIFSHGLKPLEIEEFNLLGKPIMVQRIMGTLAEDTTSNRNLLRKKEQLNLLD